MNADGLLVELELANAWADSDIPHDVLHAKVHALLLPAMLPLFVFVSWAADLTDALRLILLVIATYESSSLQIWVVVTDRT